ncbi:hypothetical protein PTTG_05667, partial [Puccinia triticina 1-1 BBBD Race 1]|uniref:Uncharacterized protein n=1 Tax=Puccinia triticina (isolate 1-1 / race 1 (BBBD)) TaxID=630390 RepID=A0A0C4EXW8_PUCT1
QQSTAPTTLDPDKGSPLSSSEHQHTADSEPITRDNRGPVTLLKAELGIQALQGPLQANRPVVLEPPAPSPSRSRGRLTSTISTSPPPRPHPRPRASSPPSSSSSPACSSLTAPSGSESQTGASKTSSPPWGGGGRLGPASPPFHPRWVPSLFSYPFFIDLFSSFGMEVPILPKVSQPGTRRTLTATQTSIPPTSPASSPPTRGLRKPPVLLNHPSVTLIIPIGAIPILPNQRWLAKIAVLVHVSSMPHDIVIDQANSHRGHPSFLPRLKSCATLQKAAILEQRSGRR